MKGQLIYFRQESLDLARHQHDRRVTDLGISANFAQDLCSTHAGSVKSSTTVEDDVRALARCQAPDFPHETETLQSEPRGDRTHDPRLKRPVLYQLS